jgi:hypothetical protein
MSDRLRLLEGLLSVPVVAFWVVLPFALWKCRGEYNGDGLYRDRPRGNRARPHVLDDQAFAEPWRAGDENRTRVLSLGMRLRRTTTDYLGTKGLVRWGSGTTTNNPGWHRMCHESAIDEVHQ